MTILKLDHVAIVVEDLAAAQQFYHDHLGLSVSRVERLDDQEVTIAFMPAGESQVELLEPTNDTSGVAKYLQKRGPGIHHICLEVDDIGAALADLKVKGAQLIHEVPVTASDGTRFAFIHPKSAFGVLLELYERPETGKRNGGLLAAVRAGLEAFRKAL
ncbi:MAG: methylmalonyl-CoA epimerase [Anaerolineae bacterium]|nr:methylmalonyl-CoA epimerase [Anaerolineae bacterium]